MLGAVHISLPNLRNNTYNVYREKDHVHVDECLVSNSLPLGDSFLPNLFVMALWLTCLADNHPYTDSSPRIWRRGLRGTQAALGVGSHISASEPTNCHAIRMALKGRNSVVRRDCRDPPAPCGESEGSNPLPLWVRRKNSFPISALLSDLVSSVLTSDFSEISVVGGWSCSLILCGPKAEPRSMYVFCARLRTAPEPSIVHL